LNNFLFIAILLFKNCAPLASGGYLGWKEVLYETETFFL
jgi:hypothetical protein